MAESQSQLREQDNEEDTDFDSDLESDVSGKAISPEDKERLIHHNEDFLKMTSVSTVLAMLHRKGIISFRVFERIKFELRNRGPVEAADELMLAISRLDSYHKMSEFKKILLATKQPHLADLVPVKAKQGDTDTEEDEGSFKHVKRV